MAPTILTFRLASGLQFTAKRALGFLEGHLELDAGIVFDALTRTEKRSFNARLDYWLSGGVHDKYFHGFPNSPKYGKCFVFKYQKYRFYGFICNPKPISDPGFQLCVLILYALKKEWETDTAELDRVNQWRANDATREAIAKIFPEFRDRTKKWKN
jgi:hypothetical protein